LEFTVGDQVSLKVTPWKGSIQFGIKSMLAPRYIGPFKIKEKIRPVAYRLTLSAYLSKLYDLFYVSMLRKIELDLSRVLPQVPIEIHEDLTLKMEQKRILDLHVKELRTKRLLW
jgi:hypothetical protein